MYIYERMNKNPDTLRASDKISEASEILLNSENEICVTDNEGVFMGITESRKIDDMLAYLPKNTRIADIMRTGTFKINQSLLIEEAAFMIKENRINFLPVVDNNNILVGTITKTDLFSTFMKILSINGEGTRVIFSNETQENFIPAIVEAAKKNGCLVNSISAYGNNGNEIILSYCSSEDKSSYFIGELKSIEGLKIKAVKKFS